MYRAGLDPRLSLRRAGETARTILGQLDSPTATSAARRELRAALTDIAYTGCLDADRLERALFDVFEPDHQQIHRAIGHPDAPLMVDSMVETMKARLTAVERLRDHKVSELAFYQARHAHLIAYAEYAARQPAFARSAPPQIPDLYESATAQTAFDGCCVHLLTAIGVQAMYPERAAQLRAAVPPGGLRTVPPAARQAILTLP